MSVLVLRLAAPLMSWSGYRHQLNMGSASPTAALPRKSAIAGLLGAAIGPVDDGHGCARDLGALGELFRLHVRVDQRNPVAEDFQVVSPLEATATQVAERHYRIGSGTAGRFPAKRASGNFPIAVSRKDYLAHSEFLLAIEASPAHVRAWCQSLRQPYFMPYLGRKSCSPTFPFVIGVGDKSVGELFGQLPLVTREKARKPAGLGGYEVSGDYDRHEASEHPVAYSPQAVTSREDQLHWVKENLDGDA